MRIGFDAKRLYNNFTGLGNHSRTTIDILTAEFPEHEYYLYTPKMRLNDVTAPYSQKEGCRTIQPHGILKGSIWRTFGLAKDLKRDGVQLFHGLSNELPSGLPKAGIPSVVTIHDVAFRTFTDMYTRQDRFIYDMKWKHACTHADRIIAISECTKRDVVEFYNIPEEKVEVVYQPVSPMYYEELPPHPEYPNSQNPEILNSRIPELPFMLYVGSVNSRKNLLGIVKALELMPKDLQLPLMVVGNGREYKQLVMKYVKEHKLEHLVKWAGSVNGKQLKQLYCKASLFIYPSFYEGFGLPVVEAQLCGCPVVTSNVSSLPEAGGPFALKADPNSAEDICSNMVKALTDTELRRKMIAGGREYAMSTFHPSVLAHNLMDVYKKVL